MSKNRKKLLVILAILVSFAVGLWTTKFYQANPPKNQNLVANPNSPRPTVQAQPVQVETKETEYVMTCSPTVLFFGDTLTIGLPLPHSASLMIEDPDGKKFYLAEPEYPETDISFLRAPISQAKFQQMNEIKLETDRAFGLLYRKGGAQRIERIFTKSGDYFVGIAPTFAMCDPIADAWCKIHYVHRKR